MTYDELSTASRIAAASKDAATHSHDISSQEKANAFLQELCDLLETETIPVSVISPDEAAAMGHGVAAPVHGSSGYLLLLLSWYLEHGSAAVPQPK